MPLIKRKISTLRSNHYRNVSTDLLEIFAEHTLGTTDLYASLCSPWAPHILHIFSFLNLVTKKTYLAPTANHNTLHYAFSFSLLLFLTSFS